VSHRDQARAIVERLREQFLDPATAHLANVCADDGSISVDRMDERQAVLYDYASIASAITAAEAMLTYGDHGDHEAKLAHAFAADVSADLAGRAAGRWSAFLDRVPTPDDDVNAAVEAGRDPRFLAEIAETVIATGEAGPRHLSEEREMIRDTFRRFAEDKVKPVAEEVHRDDKDIPDGIISGLAELGTFGLSVSTEHGGMSEGGPDDLTNMVIVTEELSRGSLGVAGSLITRPEIIATAIERGGTDEQKKRWLPAIASGEKMCAVAVTEPDFGSDVAMLKAQARRDGDEWVIDGVKTWCTFAGKAELLLLLARTDPDRSKAHRGLSLFVVEKPTHAGHEFRVEQDGGGALDARAISTIGYRGMHSFEVSFDGWRVPTTTSSAWTRGSARASTSRCRHLRPAGCRPLREPTASCRRRSRMRCRTRSSGRSSRFRSQTTS
jgi:(2S)-methylsuccinyl-CoA dehydrogenase